MAWSLPFDGSALFETENNNQISASEMIQAIDTSITPGATATFNLAHSLTIVAVPLIGIIITIILLIKSIKNKNKLMQAISLDTINHLHKKAIILLVLSIIGLSLPSIILTTISLVLTSNAKKLFDTDLETVKSKLNIVCILNIISIALLTICFTLIVLTMFVSAIPILRMIFTINSL